MLRDYYSEQISVSQPRYPIFQSYNGLNIEYTGMVKPHLFSAIYGASNEVYVKYTESYCTNLHQLLSDAGSAPKLFHTKKLTTRFNVILMEDRTKTTVNVLDFLNRHPDKGGEVIRKCKSVLDLMHTNSYCHGDLCPCNIMIRTRDETICILDFDNCGQIGIATYPPFLNHQKMNWPEGASDGALIATEHDTYWIEQLATISS